MARACPYRRSSAATDPLVAYSSFFRDSICVGNDHVIGDSRASCGAVPPSSESDNFPLLIALPHIPTVRQLCCSRLLLGGVSWKYRIYFPLNVRSCTNGRWAAAPGLCGTRGPPLRSSSTSNVKRVLLSVLYVCAKISVLPLAQTPTRNSRSVSRFRHPYSSYSEEFHCHHLHPGHRASDPYSDPRPSWRQPVWLRRR